jgi:hypothetical protein
VHGLNYQGKLAMVTIWNRQGGWYRCILARYIRIELLGPVLPLLLTPQTIHALQNINPR